MGRKDNDAISGMHMPSGQNMWSNPASDKMKKDALGLLDIPKEIPRDNAANQAPHVVENTDAHLGVIDRISPDMYSNDVEDLLEDEMSKEINDLIEELDKKGYSALHAKYAKFLKAAQDIDTLKAEYVKLVGAYLDKIKNAKPALLDRARQDVKQILKYYGPDSFSGYQLEKELKEYILDYVYPKHLAGSYNVHFKSIVDKIVKISSQISELNKNKESVESDKSPSNGWAAFTEQGPAFKKFQSDWLYNTPDGYSKDFGSFVKWYKDTKQNIGRDFGPEEASTLISKDIVKNDDNEPKQPEQDTITSKPSSEDKIEIKTKPEDIEIESINIYSEILTAIKNMQSRELNFNTPFRPERRKVIRWIRNHFGSSEVAANMVYEKLTAEQWTDLINKNNEAKAKSPGAPSETNLSGSFYETIFKLMKNIVANQMRPEKRKERREQRRQRREQRKS